MCKCSVLVFFMLHGSGVCVCPCVCVCVCSRAKKNNKKKKDAHHYLNSRNYSSSSIPRELQKRLQSEYTDLSSNLPITDVSCVLMTVNEVKKKIYKQLEKISRN